LIQPAFYSADFAVTTDAPPVPTTIICDDLDPGGYAQTLGKLTEWVGWFRRTYRVPATVVAPCWFAHSGIREELGHLWTGWLVTIHPDAGVGMIGLDWDARRDQTISRLRESTAITGCTTSAHREEQPITAQTAAELMDVHLTHELQTRSRNAIRSSALQVVLEHLEELELRHDLAARILADTVKHPETATQQDQAAIAQRLRDAAVTAHSTVDKILDSAIRTVADMQLTADREQHLAETRRDLADAIVSQVLDKVHRAADSTGPEAAWQDALEELLPADLAAERAIAIAATRYAAVDRRVTARSQHPDIEKLLAKPEHPADAGSPPDLRA